MPFKLFTKSAAKVGHKKGKSGKPIGPSDDVAAEMVKKNSSKSKRSLFMKKK